MKNTLCLCAGIFMLCVTASAQKAPIKFGDIPMEDMKMTLYPLDSGAEAVVLADFGESVIEYSEQEGFQINFERTKRIKILKQEGTKQAEFLISLYRSSSSSAEEKLSGLKAVTYNLENGKVVETKLKNDNFIREKYDQNHTFIKGAWTNVKVGSVLEYTYRVKSDFLFNFQDWEFQSTIPVRWSEYRARIPEYFNYQKYMQGYIGLVVNDATQKSASITFIIRNNVGQSSASSLSQDRLDYREDNFRWAAKDVPAFKKEPYITTSNDYISKMNFELAYTHFPQQGIKTYMGTWDDINKTYWDQVKDEINSNAGLKDDVEKLVASATTDEQKALAIYEWVKRTVLWDESNGSYISTGPRKTVDEKKGSSADINILLACMLDKAGFAVNPVLLSTRDHGFVREQIPVSSQFNYVVCLLKIGTKSFLLDATDKLLPFGVLPERCLNGSGFAVSASGFNWISLQPTIKTRTVYTADLTLTPTGEVKGTLKVDKIGYHSVKARRQYHLKGEAEYVKTFTKNPLWTLSNSKFENATDISLPFKETHDLSVNEVGMASAETIYFNPFIVAREEENPFKTESRQYPVDFGNQFEEMYMAKFVIPEGYVIEELPQSKMINLPEGAARYVYNLAQAGNILNLTSSLSINRSMYTQDVYPNLREFFNQVIAKQSEQIVLKKK